MFDLEHLPKYEDGLYIFRYDFDTSDIYEIRSMFLSIQKVLRENNIDAPLIALPKETLFKSASKEELLQIKEVIDKAINDLD